MLIPHFHCAQFLLRGVWRNVLVFWRTTRQGKQGSAGTYSVNSDCTGKLAIAISDLSGNKILAATLDLVFDDNVRELGAIFTSAVLPNGTPLATVITVEAKRLFCDN